jgi:N-acetylglucosaminyl-diphospho-decaprenol L-rhamnosyltransferase
MTSRVSIIIVNWNGGEEFLECLKSLRAAYLAYDFRVIVIDNNSSDGSREKAQEAFPEFQIINSGANLGFARANNRARGMVMSPYVLFLNPDTKVTAASVPALVKVLETNAGVGAVGCKMTDEDGTVHDLGLQWFPTPWTEFLNLLFVSQKTFRTVAKFTGSADANASGFVQKLYGGCIMVRREVLEKIGWLDDRYFMYAEDVDLCRTIRDAGWKLFYTSEAAVVHHAGVTSAKAPSGFSTLMKCESIGKLMTKYYGIGGHALYRLAVFAGSFIRLVIVALINVLKAFVGKFDSGGIRKCFMMLGWSVGIRRAKIPVTSTNV